MIYLFYRLLKDMLKLLLGIVFSPFSFFSFCFVHFIGALYQVEEAFVFIAKLVEYLYHERGVGIVRFIFPASVEKIVCNFYSLDTVFYTNGFWDIKSTFAFL